jgi:hypothetical protein
MFVYGWTSLDATIVNRSWGSRLLPFLLSRQALPLSTLSAVRRMFISEMVLKECTVGRLGAALEMARRRLVVVAARVTEL